MRQHISYKENLPYKSRFSNRKLLHDKPSKETECLFRRSFYTFPFLNLCMFFNSAKSTIPILSFAYLSLCTSITNICILLVFINLFISLSIYLLIFLSIYLSVYLSIYLSIRLSIYLSTINSLYIACSL